MNQQEGNYLTSEPIMSRNMRNNTNSIGHMVSAYNKLQKKIFPFQ